MEPLILAGVVALAGSLAAAPSPAQEEPVWPLADGRRDVLTGYQNPYSMWQRHPVLGVLHVTEFHQGVDLHATYLDDVVAMRSGVVAYTTREFVVHVETPHGVEADMYVHMDPEPWLPGDEVHAGDVLGRVSRAFSPDFNHLHVNRLVGAATPGDLWGGPGGRKLLNPLAMFAAAGDRDPELARATPQDANEDGAVFWVAPDGQPDARLPYAFGSVELLLEATDRQQSSVYFHQVVHGVGYWIESRVGGDDVASAAQPYRLVRMNDAWRGSHPNCSTLHEVFLLSDREYLQAQGPDVFPFTMVHTYRLTRTSGFEGLGGDVSALQSWRTDARRGTGSPNGTGGGIAREIHEARFPDGRYGVHALTEDLESELDTVFDVVVDNFRPYVEGVRVLDELSGGVLYDARWELDEATGVLALRRAAPARGRALAAGDLLRLEVAFSEPMAAAKLALEPELGELSALRSRQDPERRTEWSARLELGRLPRAPSARLVISGVDLAGTTLFPFADDAPRAVPFNKRADATPIVDATRDTLHVLPLADSHAPLRR